MIKPSRALSLLKEAKVVSYDVETTGLSSEARACGYVIAGEGEACYVPVRHGGGGNIPDPESFEKELASAFMTRGILGLLTVGHNIAFDMKMSRRHGVRLYAPLEDTMINEGLINDIAGAYSLEACALRYGVTPKSGAELYKLLASRFGGLPDRKQMGNFWRLAGDEPEVIEYACGDGITTLELWKAQQKELDTVYGPEDIGSLRRVHKLECDLIPHIDRIVARGLRVDEVYANQVMEQIDGEITEASSVFPIGFNVNSSNDCEALFKAAGITDYERTPTGKASFREKWLERYEQGRAILKVRQLRKARDSFVTPLIDTHNVGGRVYPILNQSKSDEYGAIGGRLSCTDPNMQAFPKRNKTVGQLVRRLIIPDDGMLLEEDDFSQQEPRLFGHYSDDPHIKAGYLADPPINVHKNTQMLLSIKDYSAAKRLAMGMLTGLSIKGLAKHLDTDEDTASRYWHGFLGVFPKVGKFQRDAKHSMLNRKYVRTLLGRKCNLTEERAAYKAVSRIIQGSGADITKTALLRVCQFAEAEGNINILMSIHDSFIHQSTPDANVAELRRILEDTATSMGVTIPIPIETEGRAKDWAAASYGSPENLP